MTANAPTPSPHPDRLRPALRGALALLSPVDCAGCGAGDIELCASCRTQLAARPFRSDLPDGTPVVSAFAYGGVVRDVVLAFKQQGRFRLGRPLGLALGAAIRELGDEAAVDWSLDPPAVVAVPSSGAGRRRRGYEPVQILALAAGMRPVRHGLRMLGAQGAQKSRGRSARLDNRSRILIASRALGGRRVIVVDDVMTTGATLVEAVRAGRAAGATVIGCCALAATPLVSDEAS